MLEAEADQGAGEGPPPCDVSAKDDVLVSLLPWQLLILLSSLLCRAADYDGGQDLAGDVPLWGDASLELGLQSDVDDEGPALPEKPEGAADEALVVVQQEEGELLWRGGERPPDEEDEEPPQGEHAESGGGGESGDPRMEILGSGTARIFKNMCSIIPWVNEKMKKEWTMEPCETITVSADWRSDT